MRTRRQHSPSNSMPRHGIEQHHIPVLLHETIELLAIKKTDIVLDGTFGGGGHAQEILKHLGPEGVFVGLDADRDAVERGRVLFEKDAKGKTAHIVEANFRTLDAVLETLRIKNIDKALFDLGWSSTQLAAGRGFSFLADEPLLMTYGDPADSVVTALRAVNEWQEETLRDILFGFGEERYARRIAHMIVTRREHKPFETARELGDAIRAAVPPVYRRGKIHPATRTFQALRIAVNDELGAIKDGFHAAWRLLNRGGRIAFITFHSVEDRLVKQLMREQVEADAGVLVVKRPAVPTEEEVRTNRRARSAKLRVIKKN